MPTQQGQQEKIAAIQAQTDLQNQAKARANLANVYGKVDATSQLNNQIQQQGVPQQAKMAYNPSTATPGQKIAAQNLQNNGIDPTKLGTGVGENYQPYNPNATGNATIQPMPGSASSILGEGFGAEDPFITQYNQDQLNAYNEKIDPQAEYDNQVKMRQARIDASNAMYRDQLNQARIRGQGRLGSGTAMQARGGLLGSDFGAAQTNAIQDTNTQVENSIENERLVAVNQILSEAQKDATAEIAAKRAAKEAGGAAYLQYLSGASERKAGKTSKAAQLLLSLGKSPQDISDAELKQAGISRQDLTMEYTGLKSEKDAADKTTKYNDAIQQANLDKIEYDKLNPTVPTSIIRGDNGDTILINTQTGDIIKNYGGYGAVKPGTTTVGGGGGSFGTTGATDKYSYIKSKEGFRADTYLDSGGVPTIGYGFTTLNGQPVRMGQKITQQEADAELQRQVDTKYSNYKNKVSVQLSPSQEAALSSLEYNLGPGVWNMPNGVAIINKINAGDFAGASNILANSGLGTTVKGTGQVLPGLINRRKEEAQLLLNTGSDGGLSPLAQSVQKGIITIAQIPAAQRAAVAAELSQAGTQSPKTRELQNSLDLVDTLLLDEDALKSISGWWGGRLPGSGIFSDQLAANQFDQLKGILSLGEREKLKGTGAISDYESKLLANSSSALGRNLSESDFIAEIKKIRDILSGKYKFYTDGVAPEGGTDTSATGLTGSTPAPEGGVVNGAI